MVSFLSKHFSIGCIRSDLISTLSNLLSVLNLLNGVLTDLIKRLTVLNTSGPMHGTIIVSKPVIKWFHIDVVYSLVWTNHITVLYTLHTHTTLSQLGFSRRCNCNIYATVKFILSSLAINSLLYG